ncbi:MAG: hypothetical protein AB1505_09140, partial [Candidatus Latescibacterota bacterium]
QHPAFEGLQGGGVLDLDWWGPVTPNRFFSGQRTPDEVVAAAFAMGYPCPGGYTSGVLLGRYGFGRGSFVLNAFPVLEQLDQHPAADGLLANLLRWAGRLARKPSARLPRGFGEDLQAIGYR